MQTDVNQFLLFFFPKDVMSACSLLLHPFFSPKHLFYLAKRYFLLILLLFRAPHYTTFTTYYLAKHPSLFRNLFLLCWLNIAIMLQQLTLWCNALIFQLCTYFSIRHRRRCMACNKILHMDRGQFCMQFPEILCNSHLYANIYNVIHYYILSNFNNSGKWPLHYTLAKWGHLNAYALAFERNHRILVENELAKL